MLRPHPRPASRRRRGGRRFREPWRAGTRPRARASPCAPRRRGSSGSRPRSTAARSSPEPARPPRRAAKRFHAGHPSGHLQLRRKGSERRAEGVQTMANVIVKAETPGWIFIRATLPPARRPRTPPGPGLVVEASGTSTSRASVVTLNRAEECAAGRFQQRVAAVAMQGLMPGSGPGPSPTAPELCWRSREPRRREASTSCATRRSTSPSPSRGRIGTASGCGACCRTASPPRSKWSSA